MVLANEISKILNEPVGSQLPTETPLPHQHHLFLLPKLQIGTCRKIKSAIIKTNREGKSAVFVSQMYSKSVTERRNAALKYRADLKEQDPSIQGYVKFLATPMIKRTGERKYNLEKEF